MTRRQSERLSKLALVGSIAFLALVALGLFSVAREFRMSCEPGFVKVRGQSGIVCVNGYRP